MTAHKHYKLMQRYVEDAAETETPWKRWQFLGTDGEWHELGCDPGWRTNVQYRRKPDTVTYAAVELPMPMMVPPNVGDVYYVADALACDYYQSCVWNGKEPDHGWFNRGLCYENKEDAITAGRARCIQWMK